MKNGAAMPRMSGSLPDPETCGSDLTTRNHRLERIRTGDVRDRMRTAVRDLPDAPCYIVLCFDAEDVDGWYAHLKTGFVAGNMLLQGSALGEVVQVGHD